MVDDISTEQYDECLEVFVSIGFRGDRLDVDEVTKKLGVEPTWVHRKGEKYTSRSGKIMIRPNTIWGFKSIPAVESSELNEHLLHALNVFGKRSKEIEQIRGIAEYSSLWVHYRINHLVASFGLRGDILSKLSAMVDEVVFSILTHDPETGVPKWK